MLAQQVKAPGKKPNLSSVFCVLWPHTTGKGCPLTTPGRHGKSMSLPYTNKFKNKKQERTGRAVYLSIRQHGPET